MKPVSGRDLCKALERRGWVLVRIRGSHHRYERAGFPPVVVPVHSTKLLRRGTQRGIMRDAGLTDADL